MEENTWLKNDKHRNSSLWKSLLVLEKRNISRNQYINKMQHKTVQYNVVDNKYNIIYHRS